VHAHPSVSPPPLPQQQHSSEHHPQTTQQLTSTLAALSQAAMRDSNITVSFSNNVSVAALQAAPHTGSSLASSTASSPVDHRVLTNTPLQTGAKVLSTVYSNLLSNNGSLLNLTPRISPRVPLVSPNGSSLAPLSGATTATGSALTGLAPSSLSANNILSNLKSQFARDASGHSHANGVSNGGGAGGQNGAAADVSSADSEEGSNGRGMLDEPARNADAGVGADASVLSGFALFFAVSQLPAVQKETAAVLAGANAMKNREKLKRIEEILVAYAEKVHSEEIPLQL
jgi:hypothetical protein